MLFCGKIGDMEIAIAAILFVLGAATGSFACCQAWRLRLRETGSKKVVDTKRSVCLSCGYKLKWYDNIPVVSWLALGGKCRKCKKKIGWWEILSEIGLGVVFAVFGAFFYANFESWLLAGLVMVLLVGFAILFISDARWGVLPVGVLVFCIVCAVLFVVVREWDGFTVERLGDYAGALAVLPVLYYLLYRVSGESWVGGGDWLVALPIALVLGDFWLAFFCLFAANLLGSLVMLPMMKMKKKNMRMRVPFGPFLLGAFMIIFLLQTQILNLV